jgi:rod shape-determining protein MreD
MKKVLLNYFMIGLSFLVAFMLMNIPISIDYRWLYPDWVILVLIYWVVFAPNIIGVISGFIVGISLDLFSGQLFGAMGLTLSTVAFLTSVLRSRLRIFRFWQQVIIISVIIGFSQLIRLWIQLLVGHPPTSLAYWFSTVVSTSIWPLVYLLLHSYRHTFKMS